VTSNTNLKKSSMSELRHPCDRVVETETYKTN
jgi:hypothetical protein